MSYYHCHSQVYAQIDQLYNLVSEVKSSVEAVEQKVEEAEKQFTTSYQKKFFKVCSGFERVGLRFEYLLAYRIRFVETLVKLRTEFQVLQSALGSPGDDTNQYRRQIRFEPPEIFRTDDYFPKDTQHSDSPS